MQHGALAEIWRRRLRNFGVDFCRGVGWQATSGRLRSGGEVVRCLRSHALDVRRLGRLGRRWVVSRLPFTRPAIFI